MFSWHNTISGHNYTATYAGALSAMNFYRFVPQGHGSTGKVPFGCLFFKPITSQEKIIDLVSYRHVSFKFMAIYHKRNDLVT